VPTARAGAWLRAPGEVYARASLFGVRGEREFDAAGESRPLFDPALYERGRYLEVGGSFYGEIGLGRDVTLLGDLPIKLADTEAIGRGNTGDVTGRAFGIPEVRLGARLPLLRGRIVAAIEPSVAIPLVGIGVSDPEAPRLGSGTASFAAALAVGSAIPHWGGYVQAGGGYRTRGGKPPDDWFWDVEAGASPLRMLRLRLRYDGVNAGAVAPSGSSVIALTTEAGGQDAHRIAPTLGIAFGAGHEVSISWRRNVAGRNALRGREWEVAYAFLGPLRP